MSEEIKARDEWEMGHLERIAWRKAGRIPCWEWFKWQRVNDTGNDFIVEGGIPRLLKSGKRKGHKTWRNNQEIKKVVVTAQEIEAEEMHYQETTGKCHHCLGEGEVFQSWSATDGTKYRPCKHCNSTGQYLKTAIA